MILYKLGFLGAMVMGLSEHKVYIGAFKAKSCEGVGKKQNSEVGMFLKKSGCLKGF